MPEYQVFEEIAHCGGQITFNVTCDAQGNKAFRISLRHARPVPAAWAGIYALASHGIPVSDFRMGGIGQEWDPPLPPGCVPVFIGSDSRSCWGAQCPQCEGYFRERQRPIVHRATCPYCGLKTGAFEFLTQAQRAYIRHYVNTLTEALHARMEPGTESEITMKDPQGAPFAHARASTSGKLRRWTGCALCLWGCKIHAAGMRAVHNPPRSSDSS